MMEFNKALLAVAITSSALVGCGGSSSSSSNNDSDPVFDPVVALPSFVTCNDAGDTCTISGNVDEDFTLTDDKSWVLTGFVTVGAGNVELADAAAVQAVKDAGVTLTVEAGVHVKATSTGALLVTRGSKLMAEGTAAAPITFSSQDDNYDGMGEWGGVIVQGFATQYGQGSTGACYGSGTVCNIDGEGGTDVAKFGGNDNADNSGIIKYVRIAEAGKSVGVDNEINGLTLQGVGYGTVVDYVQVHNNLDDGVEWFGGTVNAKHLVLTGNDDDDIDFDEGYMGNVQYALIIKNQTAAATPQGSNDPRGIEGNSDLAKGDETPETNAAIANVTIIGGDINNGQPAVKLRGKVNTTLAKAVSTGFTSGCLEVKTSEMTNVTIQDYICDETALKEDAPASGSVVATAAAITFNASGAAQNAEAVASGITADLTAVNNGSSFAFDATTFAGAVNPDGTDNWTAGWTIEGSLDGLTSVNAAP
jgi:hypothetical protein